MLLAHMLPRSTLILTIRKCKNIWLFYSDQGDIKPPSNARRAHVDIKILLLLKRFPAVNVFVDIQWVYRCYTDAFLSAILCIVFLKPWQRTVQVIQHTQRGNFMPFHHSSLCCDKPRSAWVGAVAMLQKTNVFTVQQASIRLDQSCHVRVNELRLAAHHLPRNSTILKLMTVQYALSSASGGSRRAKKKANFLYRWRSCG